MKKHNTGFTLIEVLVALLVFAIGMLGLAGLQVQAYQAASSAQGRTAATFAASHLFERMRANIDGVTAGDYAYDSSNDGLPAAVANCNTAAGCGSATNMAQNDLREWLLTLNQALPILNSDNTISNAASIVLCNDSTPTITTPTAVGGSINCDGLLGQWTIYIDWTDQKEEEADFKIKRQTFTFVP